jgi:hypothetical protein
MAKSALSAKSSAWKNPCHRDHRIQPKGMSFADVPKSPSQRIDVIDQQTVTVPLGEIDREKSGCAWHMSTAIVCHEVRLNFVRVLTRKMRFVPQRILSGAYAPSHGGRRRGFALSRNHPFPKEDIGYLSFLLRSTRVA